MLSLPNIDIPVVRKSHIKLEKKFFAVFEYGLALDGKFLLLVWMFYNCSL